MPPQSSDTLRPNRALRAALAVVVVALLWVAVPRLDRWQRRHFAERMARLAETSSGGAAQLAVRRLADAGDDAIDALARVAGSANVAAASSAQRALANRLATWEIELQATGDERLFAERLQALASALAGGEPAAAPTARLWMRRTALRIVDQCGRLAPEEALGVLADCDAVLSSSAPVVAAATAPAPTQGTATEARPVAADSPDAPVVATLPLRPSTSPPATEEEVRVVEPQPPVTTEREVGRAPASDLDWTAPPVADPVTPTPPHVAEDDSAARPLPAPRPSESVVDVPSPIEARRMLRRYRQMSDQRLAAELTSAGHYQQLAIEQVLRERRLPSVAAPRSARPAAIGADAESQLFERVGELSAPAARRLLRELASDSDESPEMRLQALTLLATTGDPRLGEIARERAMEDIDPRVAELAARILDDQRAR